MRTRDSAYEWNSVCSPSIPQCIAVFCCVVCKQCGSDVAQTPATSPDVTCRRHTPTPSVRRRGHYRLQPPKSAQRERANASVCARHNIWNIEFCLAFYYFVVGRRSCSSPATNSRWCDRQLCQPAPKPEISLIQRYTSQPLTVSAVFSRRRIAPRKLHI